jgi:acyl dehydratase
MLNTETLLAYPVPASRQVVTPRECILYALGVGYGLDPTDAAQLGFVWERGLRAVPSMAAMLAYPGLWIHDPALGIDLPRLVAGQHRIRLHGALPTEGVVLGRSRISGVVDKGPGRHALITVERLVTEAATGRLLATVEGVNLVRGGGGFGGPAGPEWPRRVVPARRPDLAWETPTLPNQALLYRLQGDLHMLHVDPDFARQAGFARPILHGLCTFGIAGHALLRLACGYDTARFGAMQCRFSAPLLPGEALRVELWREAGGMAFRAVVPAAAGGRVVLDDGWFEFA